MSIDFKIQNKCDHLINWEEADLQTDLRSIYVNYPIAATASLKVRINFIDVPSADYKVIPREVLGATTPPLYIKMNERIRHNTPLIETTYTTYSKYCPKCRSVNVLDDPVLNVDGGIRTVRNEVLLVQNVEKYIITQLSSNLFHKWLGTELHNIVGSKIFDQEYTRSQIVEQVNSAITKLQNVQRQALAAEVDLTNGELFDKLISIDLEPTDDPTMVLVIVVFTAKSGKTLEYNQFLELSVARERRAFS